MQQASLLLRRSPKTIYEWISKGRLNGALRRRGKGVLFYRDRLIVLIFNGSNSTKATMKTQNETETIAIGDRVKLRRRGKLGIWQAHFTFKGKHDKKSMETANLREATRLAWELDTALSNGTFKRTIISTMSPTEWFDRWIALKTAEGRSHKTIYKYKEAAESFIDTLNGKAISRMSDITAEVFQDHRLSVQERTSK